MNGILENPFYYLENFDTVLTWVHERYPDLLDRTEIDFIRCFTSLPLEPRALLVRMIMRKGNLFRESKLTYAEIGSTHAAAQCLIAQGWIETDPLMSLEQLFALLTKNELTRALGLSQDKGLKKIELWQAAQTEFMGARRFSDWHAHSVENVYKVCITPICDRIRLMFFGNLHQDWTEFVLSDLGIFSYEKVAFPPTSRAFHYRHDVDVYLRLHDCRERFYNDEPMEEIEEDIAAITCSNSWLQSRRSKFLFQMAQRYEQLENWAGALRLYDQSRYPGARIRSIRVLEKDAQFSAAMELAERAEASPESETEAQHLMRIMPRLRRQLGQPRYPATAHSPVPRIDLTLPRPPAQHSVEEVARRHIERTSEKTCVYYVENTLINSLFGLLCWEAIFTAVPGAFFHPFQIGPADLHSPDFYGQRLHQFESCLAQLDSQQYQQTIRENFIAKMNIQSPFVAWEILTDRLMEYALSCLPAKHLSKWFERILLDIPSNRSGFPDLIQLWPEERRYRMIEVKGPGDRLQDNQIRLLDYCIKNQMPVAVCHVQWENRVE